MEDSSEDSRTIYCGNLSEEVTEEILYEFFLQAGPVEKISIPSRNGKKCNYGFVTYKHAVSVPYAINLFSEETLFKRKMIMRSRGLPQNSNSPRDNSRSDDRRNSSPDVSIIHDKHRPHHQSPHHSTPLIPNGMHNSPNWGNNNGMYRNLPQTAFFINSPVGYPLQTQFYTNVNQIPNQAISPHIFANTGNRFSNWK